MHTRPNIQIYTEERFLPTTADISALIKATTSKKIALLSITEYHLALQEQLYAKHPIPEAYHDALAKYDTIWLYFSLTDSETIPQVGSWDNYRIARYKLTQQEIDETKTKLSVNTMFLCPKSEDILALEIKKALQDTKSNIQFSFVTSDSFKRILGRTRDQKIFQVCDIPIDTVNPLHTLSMFAGNRLKPEYQNSINPEHQKPTLGKQL